MKKKQLLALLRAFLCIFPVSACSQPVKSEILASPAKAKTLEWKEHYEDNFLSFKDKANTFAAKFSSATYKQSEKIKNFAVSPVSVFMALGMASACADALTY